MVRQIVVINGNPSRGGSRTDEAIDTIERRLRREGYIVTGHNLARKNIRQCVGCWDCWWKTPGICRFNDDVAAVLKDTINSDLVIYFSPMIMGMYSALLKKLHDRTIPLVHPFIELIQGECHHRKRYPHYPKMGVIVEKNDASAEEIENVRFIFNRIALNFHSEVKFFHILHESQAKGISDEISRL